MSTKIKRTKFALFGRKVGMTQIFKEDGAVIPVTVIEAGPCEVTQVKTKETDGYSAVQMGFSDKKKSRIIKAEAGHFAKAKVPVKRMVAEVRLDEKLVADYSIGMKLTADLFQVGDKVDVVGTSIGKGFQGVMKRHNFRGARHSHNHEFFRHGGSIGNRSDPGKVFKGKKMPGHMGAERVTIQNLEVVAIEADKNYVLVRGAIPGSKNGYVTIQASAKGGFAARSPKASGAAAEAPAEQA